MVSELDDDFFCEPNIYKLSEQIQTHKKVAHICIAQKTKLVMNMWIEFLAGVPMQV